MKMGLMNYFLQSKKLCYNNLEHILLVGKFSKNLPSLLISSKIGHIKEIPQHVKIFAKKKQYILTLFLICIC